MRHRVTPLLVAAAVAALVGHPIVGSATAGAQSPTAASPATATTQGEPLPPIPTSVPAPAAVPSGTAVEQATGLADQLDGDRDGWLPAILTAYRLSGYFIVDSAGQPVGMPPIDASKAMIDALWPHPTVDFWELWLLASLQHGLAISMSDWAGMMRDGYEAALVEGGFSDGTEMDPADLADAVLDDIADGVHSDNPERAFFAAFVARRAATLGADPSLPGVSAGEVWLDPISLELLTREFALDLLLDALPDALEYESAHGSTISRPTTANIATIASSAMVAGAANQIPSRPSGQTEPTLDQEEDDSFFQACVPTSKLGAQGQDIVKTIIKWTFKGQSLVPSELTKSFTETKIKLPGVIDALANNHPGTKPDKIAADALKTRYETFSKVALPAVEAMTDIIKVLAFELGIRVGFDIDKKPLTRTYDGGQKGTITAHMSFDPSGTEVLYCADFVAQAFGLSLTLPAAGDLDAPTQLTLVTGLDHLDLDKSPAWRRAVKPDHGVVTAGVMGKQGDQMTVDANKPVPFKFTVRADLALKDSTIGKDFQDAFKTMAAGVGGGVVKGVSNYVQRMTIFGGRTETFEGVDFAPKGTWSGTVTVTYAQSASESSVVSGKGGSITHTLNQRTDISDTYTLRGEDPKHTPGTVLESMKVSLAGQQSTKGGTLSNDVTRTVSRGAQKDPTKAQSTKRIIGCDWTRLAQLRTAGSWGFKTDATASVNFKADGSYAISIQPGSPVVTVPTRELSKYAPTRGMDCYAPSSSSSSGYVTPPSTAWGYHGGDATGTVDLRRGGISGSQTIQGADGSVVTVSWDLKHEGPIWPLPN